MSVAYLFIICIKLWADAVRENADFKGIPLFDKEFKSKLFADDATFTLVCSFESYKELINILEAFKSISGLKLINKKTSALGIGSLSNTEIE